MMVVQLEASEQTDLRRAERISWWDSDTGCTIIVSEPSADPDLWTEYLEGAQRSYRKHGVEAALDVDVDAIASGADTSLFFAAVDEAGRVAGGLRTKGPYRSADESHAVVEWAGHPGLHAARKMITDRLPFGVVEMKSAWVADDRRNRLLTKTLARAGLHAMPLLDVQFIMATSAAYVLDRWRSSGGVVAWAIPAAPYPDERYRTQMMWWDRRTFLNLAEPEQVPKILTELAQTAQLTDGTYRRGDIGAWCGVR